MDDDNWLDVETVFKWTTEPPTAEGWYWARRVFTEGNEKQKEIQLYYFNGSIWLFSPDDYEYTPNSENFTHWLGPLPIPEPPQGE